MSNVVRMAIVDPNDATRSSLKSMLLGIDAVWLEAECSRYEFFSDVLEQTKPDIALVSVDADPEKALLLLAQISQEVPTCAILVVSSSQEGSLILQAMRNGAREFLNFPIQLDDFMAALDRIQQTIHKSSGDGPFQGESGHHHRRSQRRCRLHGTRDQSGLRPRAKSRQQCRRDGSRLGAR